MNRHRTHQIDELAQLVLRGALPTTWVINEQRSDYAKDFHVEVGEDDGDLTGSSFYIQLKGQEKAAISSFGSVVKFSLESKYASYYSDKIKDLPVFLVVADVNQKKGWWVFLQPVLEADQTWRKKKSLTIKVPVANDIADISTLRAAVIEAKRWMRLHHSVSIQEAVIARKEQIIRADPRFDVKVSLVDEQPVFHLMAKEDVQLKLKVDGDLAREFSDMIDQGGAITLKPGDITIMGSKLFERMETEACILEAMVRITGSISLVCLDTEGKELARVNDVPGQFTGGQKKLWFDGELSNSPFVLRLGPIARQIGGSVTMNLRLNRWDGQLLMQLAYFDRLHQFFHALPKSASTTVECQRDGNCVFSVSLPLQNERLFVPLSRYLDTIAKARTIARRFNVNPTWKTKDFDEDAIDTIDELYAILFENWWSHPTPNVRFTAECLRETFRFDMVNEATYPTNMRLTSQEVEYDFLGEKINVGPVTNEYSEMSLRVLDKKLSKSRKAKSTPNRQRSAIVRIELAGSRNTIKRVWIDGHDLSGQVLLSSQAKIENQ